MGDIEVQGTPCPSVRREVGDGPAAVILPFSVTEKGTLSANW
jgi:hypothetical protein